MRSNEFVEDGNSGTAGGRVFEISFAGEGSECAFVGGGANTAVGHGKRESPSLSEHAGQLAW